VDVRREAGTVFDIDQLVADCRACLTEAEPRRAIKETLTRAVADPSSITAVLPPDVAGITLHHQSDDLTVLEAVWAPGMRLYPHDHQMWACIGIYAGQEDNEFFRRPPDRRPGLVESGGKQLRVGDVTLLGSDTIHAVTNPLGGVTAAIHVYGGDFVNQPRSQWLEPARVEEAYDLDRTRQVFADANAAWQGRTVRGTEVS
jgi:predicted metal-dependent enzyme (double-stranded beta helix superfamily)